MLNDTLNVLKVKICKDFNELSNNEILALAYASQYKNVNNVKF